MISRRAAIALPFATFADAAEQQEAEISLFDGVTSSGWLSISGDPFPQRSWCVDGGCLKVNSPKPGAMQDLRTAVEFEYFDLSLEWKLAPGGNSGVKYSLSGIDSFKPKDDLEGVTGLHARARGLEFQIGDSATPDVQRGPQYAAGALYGICAPATPATVRAGEFNSARIVYTTSRLEHWINGELLLRLDPSSENFAARIRAVRGGTRLLTRRRQSPIALQNHGSEAWFRNLRIRRISADA